MASAFDWSDIVGDLACDLQQRPLFPTQSPDGKRDWSEDARRLKFRKLLREQAPSLKTWHTPNEGRRNPQRARAMGIVGGVFDDTVASGMVGSLFTAYLEFKGYDARGKAGLLNTAQIEWGNAMHRAGHPVAMFFCPFAAVAWLRTIAPAAFVEGAR